MTRPSTKPTRRSVRLAGIVAVAILGGGVVAVAQSSAEPAKMVPLATLDETGSLPATETAILAGGCFWGVQGVFQHVEGVTKAVSGYAGGDKSTAEYETVSTGRTGHAESVEVTFDPHKISYGRLLQIYFSVAHDPTELNRQGPDTGTQYRSTIFPTTPEQAAIAKAYVAQLGSAHVFDRPIVTTVEAGRTFYPAEAYHQDFLALHPTYPYIAVNDLPKVENLRKLFTDVYRPQPVLVAALTSNKS